MPHTQKTADIQVHAKRPKGLLMIVEDLPRVFVFLARRMYFDFTNVDNDQYWEPIEGNVV